MNKTKNYHVIRLSFLRLSEHNNSFGFISNGTKLTWLNQDWTRAISYPPSIEKFHLV